MVVLFPNELLVALKEEPEGFRQRVLLGYLSKAGQIVTVYAGEIV